MGHTHMERGDLAQRPRVPDGHSYAQITTTTPEVMVAALPGIQTIIYHLALSNADTDMATATVKFGTTIKYVFNLAANGGTALLNLYHTEISTSFNEAVSVTLSETGTLDVTIDYIQN